MTDQTNRPDLTYDTPPRPPLRTVDRPDDSRPATPEAQAALVNMIAMHAPHVGEPFSQRQLARKVLAGRSYQAVQAWLNGEPVPRVTADWLLHDLQRVDARAEDRMIRVAADEIAIVVRSGMTTSPASLEEHDRV